MVLFCALFVPLLFLFRRSLVDRGGFRSGMVIAVACGIIVAAFQAWIGDLIPEGRFGFLRWLHFFVDVSSVPAIFPILVWAILRKWRDSSFEVHLVDFAFLWLIPVAISRAIIWSATPDPSCLVLMPLLWSATVVGISFCIDLANDEIGLRFAASIAALVLIPILAATSSWAFFAHYTIVGFTLLVLCSIPAIYSLMRDFRATTGS